MLERVRAVVAGWANRCRFGMTRRQFETAHGSVIVTYHGVAPRASRGLNSKTISTQLFEAHLRLLRRYCAPTRLAEVGSPDARSGRLRVAVTFDDGFESVQRYALPLLERYEVPATLFVTPAWALGRDILVADLIDLAGREAPARLSIAGRTFARDCRHRYRDAQGAPLKGVSATGDREFLDAVYDAFSPYAAFRADPALAPYWKLMTPGHLQVLARHPLVDIGSHGLTHRALDSLAANDAAWELAESRAALGRALGHEPTAVAHPFGRATLAVQRLAAAVGFGTQYLCAPGTPPLAAGVWNRLSANPYVAAEADAYGWYAART